MEGIKKTNDVELKDVANFDHKTPILAAWAKCHLLSVELFALCANIKSNKAPIYDRHCHENSKNHREFTKYKLKLINRLYNQAERHQQECKTNRGNQKFLAPRTACPDKQNKLPFRVTFLAGDLDKDRLAKIFIHFRTTLKKVDGKTIHRCLELNGKETIERTDLRSKNPNVKAKGIFTVRYTKSEQKYISVVKEKPPYNLQEMNQRGLPPKWRLSVLLQLAQNFNKLHKQGQILGDLTLDEIGIDFKSRTVSFDIHRKLQKSTEDQDRWVDLWPLNSILSQALPPTIVEQLPLNAKMVLNWIQQQLTMEAITHNIISTDELVDLFRLCLDLTLYKPPSDKQQRLLDKLRRGQRRSAEGAGKQQILAAWEKKFPDHYEQLYKLACKHRDHPFDTTLHSSQINLPWRLTLQQADGGLPNVYVHFDEMIDEEYDDYDLYPCTELRGDQAFDRIERRSLNIKDGSQSYSPAKKELNGSRKMYRMESKRIVKPLCQIVFHSGRKEYLSVIMPKMDLHMGELEQVDLTPLQRLRLFEGVVEALADLHTAKTLHRDVCFEKFMFNRNDLKVKAIDAGENIDVEENPPWVVDLIPLGQKFLPLCHTETFTPITQQIFEWIAHRLSPDPAQADPIPMSQVLLAVQLCRALETDGEPLPLWNKLDSRNQVELIGWWDHLEMELPSFVKQKPEANRLELLLGKKEANLSNMLGLIQYCFLERERQALHEWIQKFDPPKSSLAQQALTFFNPEQHHNLCMPLLLYAQAVMNGDEQTWEHLPSLAGNGTYLADLCTHLLNNCDLESKQALVTLQAILPYCFYQLDPNGNDPVPGTLEFRLRCIQSVVANAKEPEKITLLDKLIKHWLEGKSDGQFNNVIQVMHTKLTERRALLFSKPNAQCDDIRQFCRASLDWAISIITEDDQWNENFEAYTTAITPGESDGARSD